VGRAVAEAGGQDGAVDALAPGFLADGAAPQPGDAVGHGDTAGADRPVGAVGDDHAAVARGDGGAVAPGLLDEALLRRHGPAKDGDADLSAVPERRDVGCPSQRHRAGRRQERGGAAAQVDCQHIQRLAHGRAARREQVRDLRRAVKPDPPVQVGEAEPAGPVEHRVHRLR
jgi:hypothetical protein